MQMNKNLLRLLQLSDPALPVGGYAHSAGLETYVQAGIVNNQETATEFVQQMLSLSLHYTDAALMSLSYDTAVNNNFKEIQYFDNLCSAIKLAKEMRLASNKLGLRLLKIFQPLCSSDIASRYARAIKLEGSAGHYCIAFGIFAEAMKIPKPDALHGFYYNAAAGFVTNCVKLVPLSQQAGQEILFSLHNLIEQLVISGMEPDPGMIGLCCTGFDIRSMQHERLYSRLYMS